jgi:hypothetical protein
MIAVRPAAGRRSPRRMRSLLLLILVIAFFTAGTVLGGAFALALWSMAGASFLLALE